MTTDMQARQPEGVTRLVAERLNAKNLGGCGPDLYQPHAVLAYPAGIGQRRAGRPSRRSTNDWLTPA